MKEIAASIQVEYGLVIGKSYVQLEQLSCRQQECNAGNMFNDAFIQYFTDLSDDHQNGWSPVSMSMINGGNIRGGMSIGNLTKKDVVTAAPFGNLVGVLTVTGAELWEIFQHSASQYKWGGFLQVSGIRYQFNSKKPIGERLEWVRVRCAECTIPSYEDLDLTKTYRVATNSYLARGGDNYTMINQTNFDSASQIKDFDVIMSYITNYSPITVGIEDRIIDSAQEEDPSDSTGSSAKTLLLSNCLIIVFVCLCQLFI